MSRLSVGLLQFFKVVAYGEIDFNMLLGVVGGSVNSFGGCLDG